MSLFIILVAVAVIVLLAVGFGILLALQDREIDNAQRKNVRYVKRSHTELDYTPSEIVADLVPSAEPVYDDFDCDCGDD